MAWTTTEPSPTPDATRLTEPERTSPTAKIPGVVVANGEDSAWPDSSRPVRTKPLLSSVRQRSSHSVFGSAPIMTNRFAIGRTVTSPLSRFVHPTWRKNSSPSKLVISLEECTVIFAEVEILLTR